MKILKIRLGLFSLLAVLAVSVFLTSCEQESVDIIENVDTGISEYQEEIFLTLPETMNDKSQSEIIEFIEGLSKEEIEQLSDSSVVNDIESRSCGYWSYHGSGCSAYYGVWFLVVKRWCGPPSYGSYEYRITLYMGSPC